MRKLGQSTGERRFRGIDTTGFTLIELLVVLTIIGVLAAAGTVGMSRSRAQGHVATMRADLRSIAVAQEVYFEDQSAIGNVTYASDPADMVSPISAGIVLELRGDAKGWSARTTHPAAPGYRCALFRGTVVPHAPATKEGLITCD